MALSLLEVTAEAQAILDRVEEVVVGKRDVLELVLIGILADGHVLLEDLPGVAKTLIARSFAQATGIPFARVQFTPDLMPSDITGSSVFDQRTASFDFRPGPVFTSLLLGDEINRATPKTQAALLEAMQERQVTAEGVTHRLERPFVVLATQNPIEYEGTYPLPEAQLDRFLLRVTVGYPSDDDEVTMLARRIDRRAEAVTLQPVIDRDRLVEMQEAIEDVHVSEAVRRYIVDVVRATRAATQLQVGASPRGSLALLTAARARAVVSGRDFVTPDDVKVLAPAALAHRVSLRPELWVRGVRTEQVIDQCLTSVPVPPPEPDPEPQPATGR
ncbi:MAG: MoxR family ATPase [Acidimicrobiia bacterium]|nr:MoxR family ATPase [Acidimicrobiia bacterium]